MARVVVSSHEGPVENVGGIEMRLSTLVDPALALEQLIPGLPDDVALQCLLRVSVDNHAACKAVCKRWYSLFRSKDQFFSRRKEVGFREPWLFVLAFEKSCSCKIEWRVLDLTRLCWHTIPAMPCSWENVSPHGFNCVSIPHEGVVYVCGGVISDVDCPLNLVLKYQVVKNRWSVMKRMPSARSFFASGVIEGMIYVAGGNGAELFELGSAEVFDTRTGEWRRIANMCTNMGSYDAAVVDGKLLVTEGWFWPFNVRPLGQIYDPSRDKWENMAAGLREGWTGSSAVMHGHLFVVTEHETRKLKVYDTETDSWSLVEGPGLPEMICKPFCVTSWEWSIYVVAQNLHVAVGNVFRSENKCRFSVQWRLLDAPPISLISHPPMLSFFLLRTCSFLCYSKSLCPLLIHYESSFLLCFHIYHTLICSKCVTMLVPFAFCCLVCKL